MMQMISAVGVSTLQRLGRTRFNVGACAHKTFPPYFRVLAAGSGAHIPSAGFAPRSTPFTNDKDRAGLLCESAHAVSEVRK